MSMNIPCPSNKEDGGCWTYSADTNTCNLDESCVSVKCDPTSMSMGVKKGVFNGDSLDGFNPDADDDGHHWKTCDLGDESCLSHALSSAGDK